MKDFLIFEMKFYCFNLNINLLGWLIKLIEKGKIKMVYISDWFKWLFNVGDKVNVIVCVD